MSNKSYMTLEDLTNEYQLALRDYKQYVSVGKKYQTEGTMNLSRLNLLVYIAKTYYSTDLDTSYRGLQQQGL